MALDDVTMSPGQCEGLLNSNALQLIADTAQQTYLCYNVLNDYVMLLLRVL